MKQDAGHSRSTEDIGPRIGAVGVLVVGVGVILNSVLGNSWNEGQAPVPYAWRDVALIHVVCAVPLAVMLAVFIFARVSFVVSVAIAAGCLAAGVAPFTDEASLSIRDAVITQPWVGLMLRPLLALAWALAVALSVTILLRFPRPTTRAPIAWQSLAALGALGTAALIFPPATYVDARCRHDLAKLSEWVEQSRIGESHALVQGLLVLDSTREWNNRSLPEVAAQLKQLVRELETSVAKPLGTYASTRERLEHSRRLAMLGRTGEALEVLAPVKDLSATAEVESLRGIIHETRGEWEEGLTAYREAKHAWEARPASPVREQGMIHATAGIAYCLRKSGRYVEAEAAYQELLVLSPTADTHFLLARFYEDAQQAAKSQAHARRAMELAPDRFSVSGDRLIRKLSVSQFGCLAVFNAQAGGTSGSSPEGGLNRIR